MCGISGVISNKCDANGERLAAGNNAMAHRGPNDEGYAFSYDGLNFLAAKGADSISTCCDFIPIEEVSSAKAIF